MAIIKHIAIKNSNYDAAFDYLTTAYDEFRCKPILNEDGSRIPREDYLIDGILCDPFTYGIECEASNYRYGKNQLKNEIKAHHYIISFDPRDKIENGLTTERAQELGMAFARKNFPGHQAIVCTHPDGHNGNGNIHVHIVINSLRIENAERQPFMERPSDCLAGMKHHVSKTYLDYLKQEVMDLCQRENLYQVDLLNPAKARITDKEYWAQRRGQADLDKENAGKIAEGVKPEKTKFETEKEILRNAIKASMKNSHSVEELKDRLLSDYGIFLFESRGRFSFQMPGRTKAIRARQLGTDFEKESVLKYFEEIGRQAEIPFTDENVILISTAADHSQVYTDLTRPETSPVQESSTITHKAETASDRKSNASQEQPERKSAATKQPQNQKSRRSPVVTSAPAPSIRLITDLETCIKAQQNRYYAQKVKITNLKEMAKTVNFLKENGIGTREELASLLTASSTDTENKRAALKATEERLKTVNLLIKNSGQYFANKKVYREYLKARNKKAFREEHTAEILLYEAARKALNELSGGQPIPSLKQLRAEKEKLVAKKNEQYEAYSFARTRLQELQNVKRNVDTILQTETDKNRLQRRDEI